MPPSVNALYVKRGRGKGLALSDKATAFREHVKKTMQKQIAAIGRFMPDSTGYGPEIYGLSCVFYFNELENPVWFEQKRFTKGARKGELKVKLRYKRIDTDNRLKFLQDWMTKCLGLSDDALVFRVVAEKRQTDGEEHVVAVLFRLERDGFLPQDPRSI
jgi:Holliday junction resolvase RusA-like endonuclease